MEANASPTGSMPAAFAALFKEQRRALSCLLSLPRVIETARGPRVGATPSTSCWRGDASLLHYTRETPATQAEPVLFCYALINRPYILDLQPDKSVVRQYLDRGFDVYLIDWGVPTDADRGLTLQDYVCGFLDRSVELDPPHARRQKRPPPRLLHGGHAGGAATARCSPDVVKTLTLLAAPIDFAGQRIAAEPVDRAAGPSTSTRCWTPTATAPPGSCRRCFLFMNPIRNFIDKGDRVLRADGRSRTACRPRSRSSAG